MTENNFELAARRKLRVASSVGDLTVEQLWDLPLTSKNKASLDAVGMEINRELRTLSEDSLVETRPSPRKAELALALDIVKHIISVRQAENAAALDARSRADEKAKIMDALAARQANDLASMDEETLKARLAQLS